jgi:hypothetical protein
MEVVKMKINHNQVRGFHEWVKANRTDTDGKIYGWSNTYYEITVDGEYVCEVFEGELKATIQDSKTKSNGMWWVAVVDGQTVGNGFKSRKKAIEFVIANGRD